MTTEGTPSAAVKALLHRLVDDWADDYTSLRDALEALQKLHPYSEPVTVMAEVSTYLYHHCERCGKALDADHDQLVDDLELLRLGDEEIVEAFRNQDHRCLACYRIDLDADEATWLRELHETKIPLGPSFLEDRYPAPARYDIDSDNPAYTSVYSLLYRYDTLQTLPAGQQRRAELATLRHEAEALRAQASSPELVSAYEWLFSLLKPAPTTYHPESNAA